MTDAVRWLHRSNSSRPICGSLSDKYGTPLSIKRVAAFIDGREAVAAHGPREMPVWGERFYDIWSAKGSKGGDMQGRIVKIVLYLRTIQSRPTPGNPTASAD